MNRDDKNKYDDIINLPHHVSSCRPRMSRHDRAAQFAPFSALTGYSAVIRETARTTCEKREPDEYEKEIINERINIIADEILNRPMINIIYFKKDERKSGGEYITAEYRVKKLSRAEHFILLENGVKIAFDDIYSLDVCGERESTDNF